MPSSGTNGYPITFGDYGMGVLPIISGTNVLSAWTNAGENTWSVTFNPGFPFKQVFRNGTRAAKVANAALLHTDYQWTYSGNTLTIYSSTDPTSDGSVWEGGVRYQGIWTGASSYLVFNNLHVTRIDDSGGTGACFNDHPTIAGKGANITLTGVLLDYCYDSALSINDSDVSIDSITLTNVTAAHSGVHGSDIPNVRFGADYSASPKGVSNVTISGFTTSYAGVDASVATKPNFGLQLGEVTTAKITNLITHDNGSSGLDIQNGTTAVTISGVWAYGNGVSGAGDDDGIGIGGFGSGSSNITISGDNTNIGCDVYGNTLHGIELASNDPNGDVQSSVTIKNCRVHDGLHSGIVIGGGHRGIVVEYNLLYSNADTGLYIGEGAAKPDVIAYGNTIYGNGTGGDSTKNMNVEISGANVIFKNNIAAEANGQEVTIPVHTVNTLSFDCNDYYHSAGGGFMTYQGAASSFADWKRNSGEDAQSISVDPNFYNATANDFRLISGSPAIDAGVNLGSQYQMALDPLTSFPFGIANQNSHGNGWEIGAFVYNPSSKYPSRP